MKKQTEDAVLYLLQGTIDGLKPEVSDGTHQVGDLEITFRTKPGACVSRAAGTAGGGWNKEPMPEAPGAPILEVSLAAALLYLSKCGIPGGAKAQSRWDQCIRESLTLADVPLPIEAVTALAVVQAEQVAPPWTPPAEAPKSKTARKRTGEKEVTYTIKRIAKTTVKAG